MKYSKDEAQKAREELRGLLQPGDTVWTDLRHVSRSGMSRTIALFVIRDGEPRNISGYVGKALGLPIDRDVLGVKVGGCGMDMGFAVVYDLSGTLWPRGHGCTGPNCHSNDHSNGDRDYTPHWHQDGGYALIQRWL